ncbi:MAG: Uma2 family endonuclease [Planctomycetota bacterium]
MLLKTAPATIEDLYNEPGKAELIGGRIVRYMSTGEKPSRFACRILRNLADYVDRLGRGGVYTDGLGYTVPELPSGRESFSPDVSFYDGPLPKNPMRFIEGPPTFAVEVRSESDYRPGAEEDMAAKRADYLAAGTLVVWDVDTLAERIYVYRASHPDTPQTFVRGQLAEAEPAVPGWRVSVDWIFA